MISTYNLVVNNSEAIVTGNGLAIDNSGAIIGWVQDTSNVMISTYNLLIDVSNATISGGQLAVDNSGAILALAECCEDNSWAIVSTNELVVENSWAIESLDERVVNNSEAIVSTNNLSIDNSTAITGWIADTSNVMISTYNLVVNNSEAIVTGNGLAIDNSWAILNLDERVIENSWAVVSVGELATDNSTAITGWITDTSNVMVSTYDLLVDVSNATVSGGQLAVDNSQAIIGWIQDTSNAVFNFVLHNSQAIVTISELNLANSYAIVALNNLTVDNSWATVAVRELAIANSDALISNQTLDIQTSNAVVTVKNLAVDNSIAITGWIQDTSNAVISIGAQSQQAIDGLATIDHGPAHIHFSSSVTMSYDHNISSDHKLYIHGNGVVDGETHAVNFTASADSVFIVDAGITVTLENIELNGLTSSAISLGTGSELYFGVGTVINLACITDILETWSFIGDSVINGMGNILNLAIADAIVVDNGVDLQLKNIILNRLDTSNMRVLGFDGSLSLYNVHLMLESDYTFGVGSLFVGYDTVISGSGRTFAYSSESTFTIDDDAVLTFDKGLTWSYDSKSATKDKLYFAGSKATLHLNGCTMHATATGMHLTDGTMIIEDTVIFRNEALVESEASILDTTLSVYVLGGATLEVGNGIMLYQ